jgi:hypothetical protein
VAPLMVRRGVPDEDLVNLVDTLAECINEAEVRLEGIRLRLEALRMVRSRLQEMTGEVTRQP